MAHGVHNGPAGMILFDGCEECDERAAHPLVAINHLDAQNALAMWRLMRAENWTGGEGAGRQVSRNELAVTSALYSIGVFLQRAGFAPAEIEQRMAERV